MNPKPKVRSLFLIALLLTLSLHAWAQPVRDESFDPAVPNPAYGSAAGPTVGIDEAHYNYIADGRWKPFEKLLRNDGYRVQPFTSKFSPEALKNLHVLVIVNAVAEQNKPDPDWKPEQPNRWALPTFPAFAKSEIDALDEWVNNGGSLLLVAGHMPWPGAAESLADRFDVLFQNGILYPKDRSAGPKVYLCSAVHHPIFAGRSSQETIRSVGIFPPAGHAFRLRPGGGARPLLVLEGEWILRFPVNGPDWGFSEHMPQIRADGMLIAAAATIGKGRVVLVGEAAMLTAKVGRPGGPFPNAQFVLNMLHWLSGLLPAE
ncbi:MAG: hypothetical protein AB9869_16730 [Verrucomicrobiia bacterium]